MPMIVKKYIHKKISKETLIQLQRAFHPNAFIDAFISVNIEDVQEKIDQTF